MVRFSAKVVLFWTQQQVEYKRKRAREVKGKRSIAHYDYYKIYLSYTDRHTLTGGNVFRRLYREKRLYCELYIREREDK